LRIATVKETADTRRSLPRLKQRTEGLHLALESRTPDLELVSLVLDFFEFVLQAAHLVDAFLSVTSSSDRIRFALLDPEWLRSK
jgi:hypothetical protein